MGEQIHKKEEEHDEDIKTQDGGNINWFFTPFEKKEIIF